MRFSDIDIFVNALCIYIYIYIFIYISVCRLVQLLCNLSMT